MNEKPLHLPMTFEEALGRLAKVPKSKVSEKKTPGKLKAPRARGAKRI